MPANPRMPAARRARAAPALWSVALAWIAHAGAAAAAEPSPTRISIVGLIYDLKKMVEVQESLGWTTDRYEYEELMPSALMSVCSAPEATRAAARDELDRHIAALGGPVERAFQEHQGDLGEIAELLSVTRERVLLEEAMRRARSECPFWLRPSPSFRGIETDAYRTTLNLETGGLLTLQTSGGRSLPGAGGSGRLLLGRGLSEQWTFLAGAEFGGTALIEQMPNETRFPISFVAALPLLLRHQDLTWHYEGEIASLTYFTADGTLPSPGLRIGALVGLSGLRVRRIMPWAGVGIACEYVFETSRRPAVLTLKAGARVGFDWDF